MNEPILNPPTNCWRIATASRLAFVVDAADYYAVLAAAFKSARRSIYIAGWDVDRRVELVRGDRRPDDGLPAQLGQLLSALVRRRRTLHVHVLGWDFSMIYALEREPFPLFSFGWRTPRRVHFALDCAHPGGASQHQKIIVVDDRIAFTGGIDIGESRWDRSGHAAHDPLRRNAWGGSYPPHHDVQVAVDGEAATSLADLFRDRWKRATGARIARPRGSRPDPWPAELPIDAHDVPVAIARTFPCYADRPAIREVERLWLDSIAAARRFVLIENQFLTSAAVGEALERRLAEEDGPEVVVVLPKRMSGWLEEVSMGVLRARLVRRLRSADRWNRLRVLHPVVPGNRDPGVKVHSKVVIIDDCFVRVGSANLSNRSMGLDSECDLAFESGDRNDLARAIAAFRERLLGEHLGREPEAVRAAIERHGSLVGALDALADGERTLAPFELEVDEGFEGVIPERMVLDPERPVSSDELMDYLAAEARDVEETGAGWRTRLWRAGILLLLIALLVVGWAETPLRQMIDPAALIRDVEQEIGGVTQPLVVLGVYVIASLLMIPVTLLVVETGILFGPWIGFVYAISGALVSAAATYWVGRLAGRRLVRRVAGARVQRLSRRIARRGVLAIAVIRLVPIAPFSVVNMVAGASHVGFRDFMLGTLIGMGPGTFLITLLGDRIGEAFREPTVLNVAALTLAGLVVLAVGFWLNRWLHRTETVDAAVGRHRGSGGECSAQED
jgi:phosphatidylserine/phosphatidylglycerophosphate/cardiolipin synthase-like enzyme/uncharacterized membrane protein YdjX (TVP38/TMEM64 family)